MNQKFSTRAVPAIFSIVAIVALTAAGFLLFDSRDELLSADPGFDEGSFVSYGEATAVEDDLEVIDGPIDQPVDDSVDSESAPDIVAEQASESDNTVEDIDWDQYIAEGWDVLEPIEDDGQDFDAPKNIDVGQSGPSRGQGNSTLVVITNFSRAEVTINGDLYPSYSDDGQNRGMRLPSGQEHEVLVEFDGNTKLYRIKLQPGERRLLMVELTGMRAGNAPTPTARQRTPRPTTDDDEEDLEEDEGRITVYSRPRGSIFVGDRDMNQKTPGTVDVDPGRHEVQVKYDDGEMSETKTVRVREGSRIKLFFRQSD